MSVTYETFIGMSWKIFQVSHMSHISQKKTGTKSEIKTRNIHKFKHKTQKALITFSGEKAGKLILHCNQF